MDEVMLLQSQQGAMVNGNVNFHTVVYLRELGDEFIKTVDAPQIDFLEIEQCDSSGLALMIAWLRQAKKLNKPIQFLNVPPSLRAIADVCGVSEILGISR